MKTSSSLHGPGADRQERPKRNRNRSKRRNIRCPIHGCYLDSVSQKHSLFADRIEQLRQRGIPQKNAKLLIASQTTVSLQNEWLEAFWCEECQMVKWYHVRKLDNLYQVSVAPPELWRSASNVIDPSGNPSVSEFTKKHSKMKGRFYRFSE